MMIDRRSLLGKAILGAGAAFAFGSKSALCQPFGAHTEGTLPPPPETLPVVDQIINSLPSTNDYVAIMAALANLDKSAPLGPDKLAYNRRWPLHANPLLVRMWKDVGYTYIANDCESWCGIAAAWCLMRSGRTLPKSPESSQSYLDRYGTVVETPVDGDLVVFTNYADASHGHVTIFRKHIDPTHIEVLGGNQQLSGGTNCGGGYPISVIDQRAMAIDTKAINADKSLSGHHVNKYIRPPAPTKAPAKPTGPIAL